MRSLMILLFLLFCSLQISNAQQSTDLANSKCCAGGVTNVKIPHRKIESYYRTSSICPIQAIVFKTHRGKEICVNPETAWVKGHMEKVDNRTSSSATTATTTSATATSATAATLVKTRSSTV